MSKGDIYCKRCQGTGKNAEGKRCTFVPPAMCDDEGRRWEPASDYRTPKPPTWEEKRIKALELELAAWKRAGQSLGLKEATVCLGCGKEHCDCPCGTGTVITDRFGTRL